MAEGEGRFKSGNYPAVGSEVASDFMECAALYRQRA